LNDTPITADDRPSKSHLKREMHARQALGKKLVDLNGVQLGRMELPEGLLAAIRETQRISGHEARRRQLQYVGKLMRNVDFAALQAAYDDLTGATRESVALMHRCERLRDQLMEDDTALGDFIAQHPGVDIQWLRTKVRAARQERSAERAPRQSRELYKWLYAELKGAAPEGSQELPDTAPSEQGQGRRPGDADESLEVDTDGALDSTRSGRTP
jgi:ribosome-associated protein